MKNPKSETRMTKETRGPNVEKLRPPWLGTSGFGLRHSLIIWALPTAVQTMGAPMLTIAPAAPGQATISWTPNTPGFLLQESASLSPINWTNSPSAATNPVAVPATLPKKFYRLFKP